MMFAELNLPIPSEKLKTLIYGLITENENFIYLPSHETNPYINNTHNYTVNNFIVSEELTDAVKKEYQIYFKFRLRAGIMMIKNQYPQLGSAMHVPHTDIRRRTAINFILNCGGVDTKISFYDEYFDDPNVDNLIGKEFDPDTTAKKLSISSENNKWYMLNVRYCHSVDNIETTRIALSIWTTIKYDTILAAHKDLVLFTC